MATCDHDGEVNDYPESDQWECGLCGEWFHGPPPAAADPYDHPVFVQGHNHSEPVCAWPDCQTYLTRGQMAEMRQATTPAPSHPRGEAS